MQCRRIRVEADLLNCPAVTRRAITLELLISLIPIGKYEEFCIRCLAIHLLLEAGGRLHLLVTPGGSAPLIVDIVSVVIGRPVPVDEFAVRRDGGEVKSMTWDAPAPKIAAAIPDTTGAALSVPTTSVMAVSIAAVVGTCAMTGVAIAVTRTMSDGGFETPQSDANQTRKSRKACWLPMHDKKANVAGWIRFSPFLEVPTM